MSEARRTYSWIAPFGILLLTSACIPERFTYLEPAATSGRPEPFIARCPGPPDTITFAPSNLAAPELVQVRLIAIYRSESKELELFFVVRRNFYVKRSLSDFVPSSVKTQRERAARYNALMDMPVDVEFASDTALLSWADERKYAWKLLSSGDERRFVLTRGLFQRRLEVGEFSGDWLEVRLPSVLFNGQLLEFPPIRFHRESRVLILPINC